MPAARAEGAAVRRPRSGGRAARRFPRAAAAAACLVGACRGSAGASCPRLPRAPAGPPQRAAPCAARGPAGAAGRRGYPAALAGGSLRGPGPCGGRLWRGRCGRLARGAANASSQLAGREEKFSWANGGGVKERPYRFGDLFINKLTGKDDYEFGDLSRWVGGKLQEAACQITGKETYEFGDLTKFLDSRAKEEVCKMTGKDEYQFGDISQEIARRVQAGEVSGEDMWLLLRVVLTLGAGLTPVANLLPVSFLLGLYTQALEAEVGSRAAGGVARAVAEELDRRAKGAILGKGNEDYVLGDWTKATLQSKVLEITGKDTYEFGDLSRALARHVRDISNSSSPSAPPPS